MRELNKSHKPLCPIAVGGDGPSGVDIGVLLDLLDEPPVLPRDGLVVGAVRHGRPPEGLVRVAVLEARPLRRPRNVQHTRSGSFNLKLHTQSDQYTHSDL